ncbi:MAG: carbohydrate kinase [Spirochaetia bacterium]|nr:carbohydrate kinase [Spirochaetia bacterium]
MDSSYFIGIDTGTNSSKGVLIDNRGNIIAEHTTEHSMMNPKPKHFEHDAEKDWWGDFCTIANSIINKSKIDPKLIKAVGISALGADCLPVDKNCRPLRNAILYGIDARAENEIKQLTKYFGETQINKWYGRPLCSSDIVPKILWIKNNEPEIYNKTYKFLTATSYIVAKLTNNYVIDRFLGLASFNPLYDKKTLTVNEELCKTICRANQLAEIKETTDIAGYITKDAANQTGLAIGTPVIAGTDDSGAEAISCGVVSVGKMFLQFGSSIYMILCTKELVDDQRLWREDFIIPNVSDISAGTNTAGSLINWYKDNIFKERQSDNDFDLYETMIDDISHIELGSEGLITLPYFAGERTPINDPNARGLIFGLLLKHTKAHMYKSALEGIGFSINQQIKIMESHDNVKIDKIYAAGGGVKNEIWMQIVSDIIGKEIVIPSVTIGASYGDAMMAAIAIQFEGFKNFSDITDHIKIGKTYKPNMSNHEKYKSYQEIYDSIYSSTQKYAHQLSRLENNL